MFQAVFRAFCPSPTQVSFKNSVPSPVTASRVLLSLSSTKARGYFGHLFSHLWHPLKQASNLSLNIFQGIFRESTIMVCCHWQPNSQTLVADRPLVGLLISLDLVFLLPTYSLLFSGFLLFCLLSFSLLFPSLKHPKVKQTQYSNVHTKVYSLSLLACMRLPCFFGHQGFVQYMHSNRTKTRCLKKK